MNFHIFLLGLILGWGAAIPIGPINLEVTRRNLTLGTPYGITLGLGACTADLTYLSLLCFGSLMILQHHDVLRVIGILGSFVLIYFGIMAFRSKAVPIAVNKPINYSLIRNGFEGYLLTLLNPLTILFWSSVSTQISAIAAHNKFMILSAGLGVLCGTVSWILTLNLILHHTKHLLSAKAMRCMNIIGALILFGFAVLGLSKI